MFVMKRFISILLSMFMFVSACIVTSPVLAADVDDSLTDSGRTWDMNEGKVYDVHEGFLRIGDVDLDNEASSCDVTYILRYCVYMHDSDHMYLGDVDLDGYVTVMDATYVQRYSAGFFPVPYADCTGIYCGSDKEHMAKNAYNFMKYKLSWYAPVFDSKELTDEALAAFLAILDPAINSDTDADYWHTSRIAINSCFNETLAPNIGAGDKTAGDVMYYISRERFDLFTCLSFLLDDFNVNSDAWRKNFSGYENFIGINRYRRAANYYFELIQEWK